MNSMLERLKERKLVQWALAYLAGAWLILQVADVIGEQFAWPNALLRSITVLLGVGFFGALVLAWYHGEKGHQKVGGPELLMLAGILVIAGGVVWHVGRGSTEVEGPAAGLTQAEPSRKVLAAATPVERSIAVLPFTNLSESKENEYFSDGITEDILTNLSKIGDLRVISRTSIMRYKDTEKSLPEIAQELGVVHILEGSVRRAGDRVRIVAQLIDARTDQHLWAETYDRDLKDIFAIQSEIAQKIAAALQAELSPAERRRIEAQPTENLAAYDFYLQGRDYYYRYQKEANETAIRLFKRAIQLDPSFSLAYAGLADAYAVQVNRFGGPPAWADSAIAAAQRAIALDPDLAEAHKALGTAYGSRGWYSKAVAPLGKAIELNPNYAGAINNMGVVQSYTGRPDEALRWYRKSLTGDPQGRSTALVNIANSYGWLGMFAQAEQALAQAVALQPDLPFAQRFAVELSLLQGNASQAVGQSQKIVDTNPTDALALTAAGNAHLYAGNLEQARTRLERAYAISPDALYYGRPARVLLGYTLWKAGQRERAQKLFEEYRTFARGEMEKGSESAALRYHLAAIHAVQGDEAAAYRWLQEARSAGWAVSHELLDPLLENLHRDAAFQRIRAEDRAKVARMRQRVEREGW